MATQNIPSNWEKWCKKGVNGTGARKKKAVLKCLKNGQVRGYLSDMVLCPELEHTNSMYPSLEHLTHPKNHADAVVEARVFNDVKSNLDEGEFWRVIEHFFVVGVEKGKIRAPFGKRLPGGWAPKRNYDGKKAEVNGQRAAQLIGASMK